MKADLHLSNYNRFLFVSDFHSFPRRTLSSHIVISLFIVYDHLELTCVRALDFPFRQNRKCLISEAIYQPSKILVRNCTRSRKIVENPLPKRSIFTIVESRPTLNIRVGGLCKICLMKQLFCKAQT